MPRYKLTVAYDGTDFYGWQKQHPPESDPLRTAQGVLEEAVRRVIREPISILGASRTDSGVHAIGQVAAFTCAREIPLERLPRALNSRLPDDIQVRRAEIVSDDFDPIQHCSAKGYRYRIFHGGARNERRPLFQRKYVAWSPYRLDTAAMHAAGQQLVGTYNFASFTRSHHGRESTVRTVFSCDVAATRRHRLRIDVSGDGFLYNMVRIIAGTLLEVGRGMYAPEHVQSILEARDRAAAGKTMPPEGLCLMWVKYGAA